MPLAKPREKCSFRQQAATGGGLGHCIQSKTQKPPKFKCVCLPQPLHRPPRTSQLGLKYRESASSSGWSINCVFCFVSLLKPLNAVLFTSCYSGVRICRQNKKNLKQPKQLVGHRVPVLLLSLLASSQVPQELTGPRSTSKRRKYCIHRRSQMMDSEKFQTPA